MPTDARSAAALRGGGDKRGKWLPESTWKNRPGRAVGAERGVVGQQSLSVRHGGLHNLTS